jgi:hypothetical protein
LVEVPKIIQTVSATIAEIMLLDYGAGVNAVGKKPAGCQQIT